MSLGGLGRRRGRRKLNAEVNIINLVDVVLVLLIIFMITAPMMQGAIEVRLPKAAARPAVITSADMQVQIKRNGNVIVNGKPMSGPSFIESLPRLVAASNPKKIFIFGDGSATLDTAYPILNAIQKTGLGGGLVTNPNVNQ